MEHFYAMIMAGGGGTRLWPMSRSETPKQLLPLVEETSMFQVSVERLAPLFTPDQIYVVTGSLYVEALRAQTPQIPARNFIVEPYAKNSGPAAALGIAVIQQHDPQATIAVLTADHHISRKDTFRKVLAAANEIAQDDLIVTLGIAASFPSTAFGYIRQGEPIRDVQGFSCYHSLGFTEKPDAETAVRFLVSGDYSWNSGMFIWTAKKAMAEFERQQPALHQLLVELVASVDTPKFDRELARIWEKITPIQLDYAVMEGATGMAVIPVEMGWSDVGSWDSLFDVLPLDAQGNAFKGSAADSIALDTTNTLVYSDRMTVTIGLDNIVIVDTPDALLVCHRNQAQQVKEVVNRLRAAQKHNYL